MGLDGVLSFVGLLSSSVLLVCFFYYFLDFIIPLGKFKKNKKNNKLWKDFFKQLLKRFVYPNEIDHKDVIVQLSALHYLSWAFLFVAIIMTGMYVGTKDSLIQLNFIASLTSSDLPNLLGSIFFGLILIFLEIGMKIGKSMSLFEVRLIIQIFWYLFIFALLLFVIKLLWSVFVGVFLKKKRKSIIEKLQKW